MQMPEIKPCPYYVKWVFLAARDQDAGREEP